MGIGNSKGTYLPDDYDQPQYPLDADTRAWAKVLKWHVQDEADAGALNRALRDGHMDNLRPSLRDALIGKAMSS